MAWLEAEVVTPCYLGRMKFAPFALAVLLPLLAGCGGNPSSNFIGKRVLDPCSSDFPVCTTFADCRLDESSFTQGTFPGSKKLIVTTTGPATITVSMLVTNPQAPGTSTQFTFFEPGCDALNVTDVKGGSFLAESQGDEGFPISQTVSGAGEHLIQLESDATCSFLLKVDVAEQGN